MKIRNTDHVTHKNPIPTVAPVQSEKKNNVFYLYHIIIKESNIKEDNYIWNMPFMVGNNIPVVTL